MGKLENIGFYTLEDYRIIQSNEFSPMWRCELIITERCNFNCHYCRGLEDYIYGSRTKKRLTLDEIKTIIDIWCKDTPLKNIRFSGGEPTLHPNIKEIVSYAKMKGISRIALSTNGSNKLSLYKELIDRGVNDFSISLDACCAEDGDAIAGNIKGSFEKVVSNIKELSSLIYVTVGVVLTPKNVNNCVDIIRFAHDLGVADIRIISAAQWNSPIEGLNQIESHILDAHPILAYRVRNFIKGRNVRGIRETDCHKCYLMKDDSVIAGEYHFPCVIYMREGGLPVGRVNSNMRQERLAFIDRHNTYTDPICKNNCLDVCVAYNNRYRELRHKKNNVV